MRTETVLVPGVARAEGPDLTPYLVVCGGSILVLLALAWAFRRLVGERLRARAARRSLQVVDVLPLGGKQKLVVVRCYERSFLLGLGEREVRAIAELDAAAPPRASSEALETPAAVAAPFAATLDEQLTLRPAPRPGSLGPKEGLLA